MSRRVSMRYWLGLLALVGLTAAYVHHRDLAGQYEDFKHSEQRVRALQEERRALETERGSLERRVQHLHGDPVELEATIRQNRNMVREGETIFRIEELEPQETPPE